MTSFLGSVYRTKSTLQIEGMLALANRRYLDFIFCSPGSVSESPETIKLESPGLTSEYQGMTLGEYHRLDDHYGAPSYVQAHTVGGGPCYLYRNEKDGAWYVDDGMKGEGRLFNQSRGNTVPTKGWEVRVNIKTNQRQEDSSLTITAGEVPVCSKIMWVTAVADGCLTRVFVAECAVTTSQSTAASSPPAITTLEVG